MTLSPSLESFGSGSGTVAGSGVSRAGGVKKVRKAGGVVWDGLEADGKRLKLVRCEFAEFDLDICFVQDTSQTCLSCHPCCECIKSWFCGWSVVSGLIARC